MNKPKLKLDITDIIKLAISEALKVNYKDVKYDLALKLYRVNGIEYIAEKHYNSNITSKLISTLQDCMFAIDSDILAKIYNVDSEFFDALKETENLLIERSIAGILSNLVPLETAAEKLIQMGKACEILGYREVCDIFIENLPDRLLSQPRYTLYELI